MPSSCALSSKTRTSLALRCVSVLVCWHMCVIVAVLVRLLAGLLCLGLLCFALLASLASTFCFLCFPFLCFCLSRFFCFSLLPSDNMCAFLFFFFILSLFFIFVSFPSFSIFLGFLVSVRPSVCLTACLPLGLSVRPSARPSAIPRTLVNQLPCKASSAQFVHRSTGYSKGIFPQTSCFLTLCQLQALYAL